jgi:hypothetical protein
LFSQLFAALEPIERDIASRSQLQQQASHERPWQRVVPPFAPVGGVLHDAIEFPDDGTSSLLLLLLLSS